MRRMITGLLAIGIIGVIGIPIHAFINPEFPPSLLVEESAVIAALKLKKMEKGKAEFEVSRVLKGTFAPKTVHLEWTATQMIPLTASRTGERAVLFIPEDEEESSFIQITPDFLRQ